jgi:glycosyltransferase involved in cell wall biosynthesis
VKTIGKSAIANTGIIPHVNFTDLFSDYHKDVKKVADLKLKSEIISGLHPQLLNAVKNNTSIILFFGQIKKAKGVDVLLEAMTQINKECVVVIAGKTRNENWSKYEHIISVLNIKKKVIPVIRHITDEERDLLFAISDCIVLPYRLIYQSGVLLMAMSFPMTVIASDLAPNAAIVTSGSNGLLFTTKNSADLANKIQELLDYPEEALAFRKQALHDMKKLYSAKEIGAQYRMVLSNA